MSKETTLSATYRDSGSALAVLLPASEGDRKALRYDGMLWARKRQPVLIVGGKHLSAEAVAVAAKRSLGKRNWERLLATFQLRVAHEAGDDFGIRTALARFHGQTYAELAEILSYDSAGQFEVEEQFGRRLLRAHVGLFYNVQRSRFEPAVFCRDAAAAVVVLAAIRDLRCCVCCETLFTAQERSDQVYCSLRCRETFRQRRRRAKLQEQQSKKGGKRR